VLARVTVHPGSNPVVSFVFSVMGGKEVSISAQIWHFKISTPSHVVVLLQISSVKNPVQGNNSAAYFLPMFVPTRGQLWLNSQLNLELEN